MEVKELRASTGLSQSKFAAYFEIPVRTLQDWECGRRRMPAYLLRLMEYKLRMEELMQNKEKTKDGEEREK